LNILIVFLVALAPCVFWLWLIYRWDKYMPEPKRLIIRIFLIGMGAAIPVALIEAFLYPGSLAGSLSIPTAAYVAFVVAGVTEEVGKFLVVRLGVYKSKYFEEPSDGLIYASAAALGFAFLENVVYIISFGWEVILVRGMFSNLAHVLFSVLWGYPLALTKLKMLKNKQATWFGLAGAIVAHGVFDFLLFTQTDYTWLVAVFFLGMAVVFVLMMKHANRHSPYQPPGKSGL
jgi:RsiW-degrading membrane proteinase PrsW (M82 family)